MSTASFCRSPTPPCAAMQDGGGMKREIVHTSLSPTKRRRSKSNWKIPLTKASDFVVSIRGIRGRVRAIDVYLVSVLAASCRRKGRRSHKSATTPNRCAPRPCPASGTRAARYYPTRRTRVTLLRHNNEIEQSRTHLRSQQLTIVRVTKKMLP